MATERQKYFGLFRDRDSMRSEWQADDPHFPVDGQILLAAYEEDNYSTDAFVLFTKDGVPHEVNGSHCSCHGLEDQWSPEATTWEALAKRNLYSQSTEVHKAFAAILAEHGVQWECDDK